MQFLGSLEDHSKLTEILIECQEYAGIVGSNPVGLFLPNSLFLLLFYRDW
jgi:hypothetical protein